MEPNLKKKKKVEDHFFFQTATLVSTIADASFKKHEAATLKLRSCGALLSAAASDVQLFGLFVLKLNKLLLLAMCCLFDYVTINSNKKHTHSRES